MKRRLNRSFVLAVLACSLGLPVACTSETRNAQRDAGLVADGVLRDSIVRSFNLGDLRVRLDSGTTVDGLAHLLGVTPIKIVRTDDERSACYVTTDGQGVTVVVKTATNDLGGAQGVIMSIEATRRDAAPPSSADCADLRARALTLAFGNGLGFDLSEAQLIALLGNPSSRSDSTLLFERLTERTDERSTTPVSLRRYHETSYVRITLSANRIVSILVRYAEVT